MLDTVGEVKGGCGPAAAGINFSLDRCSNGSCSGQVGFLTADCSGDFGVNANLVPQCGVDAKLAARSCLKVLD